MVLGHILQEFLYTDFKIGVKGLIFFRNPQDMKYREDKRYQNSGKIFPSALNCDNN